MQATRSRFWQKFSTHVSLQSVLHVFAVHISNGYLPGATTPWISMVVVSLGLGKKLCFQFSQAFNQSGDQYINYLSCLIISVSVFATKLDCTVWKNPWILLDPLEIFYLFVTSCWLDLTFCLIHHKGKSEINRYKLWLLIVLKWL